MHQNKHQYQVVVTLYLKPGTNFYNGLIFSKSDNLMPFLFKKQKKEKLGSKSTLVIVKMNLKKKKNSNENLKNLFIVIFSLILFQASYHLLFT